MDWLHRDERITWELEQLTAHGYEFEPPTSIGNLVTLAVYVNIDGERHRLEVDFPPLYPYFRFEVRAPTVDLPHHQHKVGKNLCLMPRGTEHWEMDKSLAWYLDEQLPKVVDAGKATTIGPSTAAEDPQAEPVTDYFLYRPDAMLLIDGSWLLPPDFTVGRISALCDRRTDRTAALRGTITKVTTMTGDVVFKAPEHLLQRGGDVVRGYIVKLRDSVIGVSAGQLWDRLMREHFLKEDPERTSILAIVMPEEHAWRDSTGQGWVFLVAERKVGACYVRAGRAGRKDLLARAPELHDLAQTTITSVGLGCLGGISAIEFAKAGAGELRIVDHDYLDPGTLLRWYLGLTTAGLSKAEAITAFIKANYPLTKTIPVRHHIGRFDDETELTKNLRDASLIYDAAAEPGVSYFLAEFARREQIPFVHVSATHGGWGGVVVRLTKDTGCWYCLQTARLQGRIPAPPADTGDRVQPAGCSDPTFTGSDFDLATIALTGVRTAISTLSTKYPPQSWDVMVISLRDEKGNLIPPNFATFSLPKDPACKACGSA